MPSRIIVAVIVVHGVDGAFHVVVIGLRRRSFVSICTLSMAAHHDRLSVQELAKLEAMMRKDKTAPEALKALQNARAREGRTGPSRSSVYRFFHGDTYSRQESEARGRPEALTLQALKVIDRIRKRLLCEADSDYLVTWDDICEAAKKELRAKGLLGKRQPMWSARAVARKMRTKLQVGKRPARARIARTEHDERRRHEQAKEWQRYHPSWWEKSIHAYIDNKVFVLARTAKDKKLMRQTRVTYHLRKPSEGSSKGCVVPKTKKMLHGMRSVDVTAAVAGDKIIMWHVDARPWSGLSAQAMYKKLGQALRKHWGSKRRYRVVEDGDPKGFQSRVGKAEKDAQHIVSWTLPPRSPDLMPLDFSLWSEIESRVLDADAGASETGRSYEKRLRAVATSLPKAIVSDAVRSMAKRVRLVAEAKGKHISVD